MKKGISFLLFCAISFYVFSQEAKNDSVKIGTVRINLYSKIDHLISRQMVGNAKNMTLNGYRIQLSFSPDRDVENLIRTNFVKDFPDIKAYILYKQPNFIIRVGDFRSKLEAQKNLDEIKILYPAAFITQDDIAFPDLKR